MGTKTESQYEALREMASSLVMPKLSESPIDRGIERVIIVAMGTLAIYRDVGVFKKHGAFAGFYDSWFKGVSRVGRNVSKCLYTIAKPRDLSIVRSME